MMWKASNKNSTEYRFILLSNVVFRFQIGPHEVELRTETNNLVSWRHVCTVLLHTTGLEYWSIILL